MACLNEFRSKVRSSALKQSDSIIAKEVSQVGTAYQELLARANQLADRFSRVGNKWGDYNDAVERAKKWLGATEPKVSKMVSEPIGAEPKVVEDQLNRARALNNEIIANEKIVPMQPKAIPYIVLEQYASDLVLGTQSLSKIFAELPITTK